MMFNEFGALLSEICSRTPLAAGRPLLWTIIANPTAGGFTIKSRWKKHLTMLTECSLRAQKNPLREAGGPSKTALREGADTGAQGLILTKAAGHASEIASALVKEAGEIASGLAGTAVRPFYLIIAACGDGTSLEILTSLFHASEEIRNDFVIVRLPMGTGNDGCDSWYLDKALDLLIEPAVLAKQRALRLSTKSGKGPFLAFNILSVGLDAFVTHMTNKMKGKLPGDSYKLWVDIASLLYDRIYKVGIMDAHARDESGKEVLALHEKILLLAVGESGKRTYGSHKWILPDERNVCAMKQMPLLRKVALKGLFAYGTHINKPEAILCNAQSVEFSSQYPILAQMDGEAVLLTDEDFPAVIEITGPVIQILKKNEK